MFPSTTLVPYITIGVWPLYHHVYFFFRPLPFPPCPVSFPASLAPPFLTSASRPHALSRSATHYCNPPECGPVPLHINKKPTSSVLPGQRSGSRDAFRLLTCTSAFLRLTDTKRRTGPDQKWKTVTAQHSQNVNWNI